MTVGPLHEKYRACGDAAVMTVLWTQSPLTAQDVVERVPTERGWSANTVKTLLARLVAKKVVAHEVDGRRYRYRPLVARGDYVAGESQRLRRARATPEF